MSGISGIGIGRSGGLRDPLEGAGEAAGGGSGIAFGNVLDELERASVSADGALEALATGTDQDLHDVMLAVEMESLSFELAVQIRNRLVEAYSEIFRMQV